MKQSFAWWCFAPRVESPESLVRAAATIGYRGVDLVDQQFWPLLKEHGLAIAAIGGHQSIADGLNRPQNHDRIERELTASLELAVRWSIPNLICFSGNRAALDDEAGVEHTATGLRRVAQAAEDAGVTLVLELLNSKRDHPDYQGDRTAWGVKVCQSVNSPRVQLLYDIYHMQIMEGDLSRTITAQHEYIAHYHTAGNPGRHEINQSQEINYEAVMRAIDATGYTGYVAQEFLPQGDPIAALREAFIICDVTR
jgi:hydroxypyruvate isomerase